MTNKPHTPVSDADNIVDGEGSASAEYPTKQTDNLHHGHIEEPDIKHPSFTVINTEKTQTPDQDQTQGMKTSSTQTPAASHIRLKQNAVNFEILPLPRVQLGRSPPAGNTVPKAFNVKALEPPVTAKGLQELQIEKIMNSLKLRHDLNFDPDLHYRANFDGDMGRKKTAQNNEFWSQLLLDLEEFTANPVKFLEANAGQPWTLLTVLKNIKDIIKTLVAPDIVRMVEETLEIEHLMQELRRGVADLERWVGTVAGFLKNCCAPIRDDDVQKVEQRLVDGHRKQDLKIICDGIANLLFLVECLALDVANHQIRCMRHQMIKETINYERHYIEKVVETGEFNIPQAYDWYRFYHTNTHLQEMFPGQYCPPEYPPTESDDDDREEYVFSDFIFEGRARGFYKGILHNLTYPPPGRAVHQLPFTFAADLDRIGRLRAGVLDAVNHEICCALVDKLTNKPPKKQSREKDAEPHHTELRYRLWMLLPHYAQEVDVKIPLREMSSPRQQSLGIPRRFAQEKWRVAAPAMAIEILREAKLPHNWLPFIEAALNAALDPSSAEFKLQQTRVINRLGRLIEDAVDDWFECNSLELFEQAAKPPALDSHKWSHRIDPEKGIDTLLRNIARMTAHMGLHHWWIWETMAYAPCSRFIANSQRDGFTQMEQPTRSPSPTVAILSALNAPSESELRRHVNVTPKHYQAVGELTGPANAAPKTPPEEAAAAMAPKLHTEAAKQKPEQDRVAEDRVDTSKPREGHEADSAVKRPLAKRQNSITEFEEDLVDPAPEQG